MSHKHMDNSRRRFLGKVLLGAAALPMGKVLLDNQAFAAPAPAAGNAPKLDPNDPQAKALNYTHDAKTVKNPARTADNQICATCMHFTADSKAAWGPCNIFGGKLVAGKGWCSAWAAKPGA